MELPDPNPSQDDSEAMKSPGVKPTKTSRPISLSQEQASPSNMSCFGVRSGAKRGFFLRLWTSSDELNAAARRARHKTTINRLTFQSRNNNPNPRPGDECTSYLRQVLRNDNFAFTASFLSSPRLASFTHMRGITSGPCSRRIWSLDWRRSFIHRVDATIHTGWVEFGC